MKAAIACLILGCGAIAPAPGGSVGGTPAQETISVGQNPALPVNAAAPTLEGILSAPTDDDNIVNDGTRKVVHFEAFFGPNYSNFQNNTQVYLEPKDLKFLIKVGEASSPSCQGMDDPSCWNWFDPNLLEGLVVRATIITSAKTSIADDGVYLYSAKWFYQDFLLGKVSEEGFNLSLLDLNLKPGDEVSLTLYEKKPENYTSQRSPLFDGYPTMVSGDGNHQLCSVNVETLSLRPPLTLKP
ncbi:MAG: hypothetical protein K8R69_03780 [Deltaproteobacteria bacterium]|nr:hypothetical protein [Deltaproteobacteria bacterium]